MMRNKCEALLPYAIFLGTLAVYVQTAWHDFVNLDDPILVYSNPQVWTGISLDSVQWAFTSQCVSNWVPVTMISHMLDVQVFGMNPGAHHLVSVLLHSAASVILYLALHRATGNACRSAAVAVLFALHPLQVESVAWIAERKDVLSAFFWMLTIYVYLIYCANRRKIFYLATLVIFLLGLLSKPMLVTLPVVLLLLDWWPLGRFASAPFRHSFRRAFIEKIPFFILSALVSVATVLVKQGEGEIVTDFTLPQRVARMFVTYMGYLGKALWPADLAVYYPVPPSLPSPAIVVLSILAVLLISLAVLLARKRFPWLVTGWFWYVVTLLPVIGLIQSGACLTADRYTYLPLVGFFIVIVWGISELAARWRHGSTVVGAGAVIALTALLVMTSRQLMYWKDSITLFSHALEVTENNWLVLNNLGQAYLNKGNIDGALWCFQEAIKAKPTYVVALVNLGAIYAVKNQRDAAIAVLERALRIDPANQKALSLLQALQGPVLP